MPANKTHWKFERDTSRAVLPPPIPPGDRCAEMVLRSMREPRKGIREHYLTAARFFALAAERSKR